MRRTFRALVLASGLLAIASAARAQQCVILHEQWDGGAQYGFFQYTAYYDCGAGTEWCVIYFDPELWFDSCP